MDSWLTSGREGGTLVTDLQEMSRQVLGWLRPGDGDQAAVSQHDAQELAWYTAPHQWSIPDRDWPEVAEVCAGLLEESGRRRAATALREHTPAVLAGWARSPLEGAAAYTRAMRATGMQPPDTPTLAWGRFMGSDEAEVRDAVERMLESALDAGAFTPGEDDWHHTQRKLVETWLRTPSTLFSGRTPADMVHAERAARWADSGTAARCTILHAVLPWLSTPSEQVAGPISTSTTDTSTTSTSPTPTDPGHSTTVEPLRFLLDAIDQGITLTATGQLPPAWLQDTAARFGWGMPAFKIRKEGDVVEIAELRDLATRARLILFRRRKGRLVLTDAGYAALGDLDQLWNIATASWFDLDDFAADIAEVAAAVLFDRPATTGALTEVAHDAVASLFLDQDGTHPGSNDVRTALWDWLRPGHALGWLCHPEGTAKPLHQLTATGRAAALDGLRHRSHAPAPDPAD